MIEMKISAGDRSLDRFMKDLTGALRITKADLLSALRKQKKRILERTARGVDADGMPFAPYSQKGPYYWYPNEGKAMTVRGKKRSAKSHAKKYNGKVTGTGVRFESYAAFKRSLGTTVVNLRGPRPPHMLEQLRVTAYDAKRGIIEISGEAADRAFKHNVGTDLLPRRTFLAFGSSDEDAIARDFEASILKRVQRSIR